MGTFLTWNILLFYVFKCVKTISKIFWGDRFPQDSLYPVPGIWRNFDNASELTYQELQESRGLVPWDVELLQTFWVSLRVGCYEEPSMTEPTEARLWPHRFESLLCAPGERLKVCCIRWALWSFWLNTHHSLPSLLCCSSFPWRPWLWLHWWRAKWSFYSFCLHHLAIMTAGIMQPHPGLVSSGKL